MFEISDTDKKLPQVGARIRVVGVGGGGCNAVNTMIKDGLAGVEYVVANTDMQSLNASLAPTKIQLGVEITKGLGAGANPDIGRKAALDEYEKLTDALRGADMVFITAGMGGGTGTGGAPVIAQISRELGALTIGVVTKPFIFEGKKRYRQAESGINSLEESVDSLITIPNQRLLDIAGETLSLIDTFKKADDVLLNAVRGIADLINNTGHINADFADVRTVMANKGFSLMGTGVCDGKDRAIKAATEAISSPLLEDITIDGATGIIINVTGSENMTMHETNEAVTLVMEAADEEAEIIFGTVIDDQMNDNIKVTVVATGLGGQERVTSASIKEKIIYDEAPTKPVQIEENLEEKREVLLEAEPSAPQSSSLAQSIKDAASRYEASKSSAQTPVKELESRVPSVEISKDKTRAKSIAEKLGFINFAEDEFDTPSYQRKEDGTLGQRDVNLQ